MGQNNPFKQKILSSGRAAKGYVGQIQIAPDPAELVEFIRNFSPVETIANALKERQDGPLQLGSKRPTK